MNSLAALISGIVNDKGRIAARSGLGAVMGVKKLKAVAVRGSGKVAVVDKDTLDRVRKTFLNQMREMPGMPDVLLKHGTCGFTAGLMAAGATPIKNWKYAGEQAFANVQNIADAEALESSCAEMFLQALPCLVRVEIPAGPFRYYSVCQLGNVFCKLSCLCFK